MLLVIEEIAGAIESVDNIRHGIALLWRRVVRTEEDLQHVAVSDTSRLDNKAMIDVSV